MAGAAGALQCGRDGARCVDLADQIDGADVDAELERGGGDEQLDLAGLQFALGLEAQLARERAVMCGDVFVPRRSPSWKASRSAMERVLTKTSVRAMFQRELGDAVVDVVPDGVGGDGAELVVGDFDGEIEVTAAADFDDGAVAVARAAEEVGDERDGVLGCGETDSLRRRAARPVSMCAGREAVLAADEGVEALEARGRGACRACRRPWRGSRRR